QGEAFGLAQLSFSVALAEQSAGPAFGNIFGTAGIPVFEFVRHAPLARQSALRLFRVLLPSMLIRNCFLPGQFSANPLILTEDGTLVVAGGYSPDSVDCLAGVKRRLARFFRNYGMVLLPGSFSRAEPGSDAHYAGTVPMRAAPAPHESAADGEVAGAPGLY